MIVAHVADLHLTERQAEGGPTLDEQIETLLWIGNDAAERGAEIILVAGDVFDRVSTPAERNAAIELFRTWAGRRPVVIVDGNHDRPGDTRFLIYLMAYEQIYVMDRPDVIFVSDALIACLPWPRKARLIAEMGTTSNTTAHNAGVLALGNILSGFRARFLSEPARAHIVLAHCELGSATMDNGQPIAPRCDLEVSEGDLLDTGADYVALGHIHKHQIIKDRICYAGSPRPTRFGETGDKGYCLVRCGDGPAEIEHIKAPYRELITIDAIYSDGYLRAELPEHIRGASVRLVYCADETTREAASAQAEIIKARLIDDGAGAVKVVAKIETVHRVRSDEICDARTNADRLGAYWRARGITPPRATEIKAKLQEIEEVAQ